VFNEALSMPLEGVLTMSDNEIKPIEEKKGTAQQSAQVSQASYSGPAASPKMAPQGGPGYGMTPGVQANERLSLSGETIGAGGAGAFAVGSSGAMAAFAQSFGGAQAQAFAGQMGMNAPINNQNTPPNAQQMQQQQMQMMQQMGQMMMQMTQMMMSMMQQMTGVMNNNQNNNQNNNNNNLINNQNNNNQNNNNKINDKIDPVNNNNKIDNKALQGDDKKTADAINQYLTKKGSPAADKNAGELMVKYGKQYGVDPRALLAIAGQETQYGKLGVGVNGMLGVGAYDNDPNNSTRNKAFSGVETQIRRGAETFARLRAKGGASANDSMSAQLAAVNKAGWATDRNWHNGVSSIYNQILKYMQIT
jgi:hypothetical protein